LGEVGRTPEDVARERALEALKQIDRGLDPETYLRNAERGGVKIVDAGWTFGQMLDSYLASKAPKEPDDPANSYREYRSAFKIVNAVEGIDGIRELDLRALPAAEITKREIGLIRDIYGRRAPSRAGKLVSYISQAFNHAIEYGEVSKVTENPAQYMSRNLRREILDDLDSAAVERRRRRIERRGLKEDEGRCLTVEELRHYVQAIIRTEGLTVPVRGALMMALLIPNRKGPWLMARWDWIKNSPNMGWHIAFPARVMKAGHDHVIPLSMPAVLLAQHMARYSIKQGSQWLFPSVRKLRNGVMGDPHIDGTALNNAIERMISKAPERPAHDPNRRGRGIRRDPVEIEDGYLFQKGVTTLFSPHDLRRTFASLLAERGVSEFYSGLVLAHSMPIADAAGNPRASVTRRHYNLYKYYNEKKLAVDAWTRLLQTEADLDIMEYLTDPPEFVVGVDPVPDDDDINDLQLISAGSAEDPE
jgi:integrase